MLGSFVAADLATIVSVTIQYPAVSACPVSVSLFLEVVIVSVVFAVFVINLRDAVFNADHRLVKVILERLLHSVHFCLEFHELLAHVQLSFKILFKFVRPALL